MRAPCAPHWAEAIEICLGGDANAAEWQALRVHLVGCAACAAAYDEAGRLAALLAGGAETDLPPAAIDEGERRLLLALGAASAAVASVAPAAAAAAEAAEAPPNPTGGRVLAFRLRTAGIAAGLLAAAAAAAALWWVRPAAELVPAIDPGGVPMARGGDNGLKSFGFRAYCIDVSGAEAAVRTSAVADGRSVVCAQGDRLQFTYSAATAGAVHVSLWAASAEGQTRLLWGGAADGALPGGVVDAAIRRTWPLEVPGELTLYGVFGDLPAPTTLTADALSGALGGHLNGVGQVHAARMVVEAR